MLQSLNIPEPVIEVAVEPKTRGYRDALSAALSKLAKEVPSFRVNSNEETGQPLIAGMGELHLENIKDAMRKAGPIRLEPIMDVEVVPPDD